MKPNVAIRNGRLEVTENLKAGSLLLHADFPLGFAMHDMKKGNEVKYDANGWKRPVELEEKANE